MNRDLHPTDGARYLLEREAELDGGVRARYRVAIYTPDAEFVATATLGADGSTDVAPSAAPDELHARLVAIARLLARDAARLRDDGLPPWPQRVLRWRR
jgi:dihydrodipicolinate synthase/N-acetylneuraminate lyase